MVRTITGTLVSLMVLGTFVGCLATSGALEATKGELKSDMQTLRQDTEPKLERLGDLQAKTNTMADDMGMSKKEIKSLQSRIKALEDSFERVRKAAANAEKKIPQFETRLRQQEKTLGKCESDYQSLSKRFEILKPKVAEAKEIFIKNIKAARDMAEMQVKVMEEILATTDKESVRKKPGVR